MTQSKKVTIVEVSLRDGLQNESIVLSTEQRIQLALKLQAAGITVLTVTAVPFVVCANPREIQSRAALVML